MCFLLQMWPDLIQKAKDGGIDVIQTYVFWNGHEPSPGHVMLINFLKFFIPFYVFIFLVTHSSFVMILKIFSIILKIDLIWLSSSR